MKNVVWSLFALLIIAGFLSAEGVEQHINSVYMCNSPSCSNNATLYKGVHLCKANVTDDNYTLVNQTRFKIYINTTLVSTKLTYDGANNTFIVSNSTYPSGFVNKSDNVICGAEAWNGTDWTLQTNSTTYTVNNTAPSVTTPSLLNTQTSNITCSIGTYSDTDGDALSQTTYSWYDDNVVISGATLSYLYLGSYSIASGSYVKCGTRVNDTGYQNSSYSVNSTSVLVGATCAFGSTSSQYSLIDMCLIIKVFTDLSQFVQDALPQLVMVFVLIITLGAVLSLIAAILYTVFSMIAGNFKD